MCVGEPIRWHVCTAVQCLQRPEEGMVAPGEKITGSCALPKMGARN